MTPFGKQWYDGRVAQNSPRGLTVDSDGDVFVADSGNQRFQAFKYYATAGTYSFALQFGQCRRGTQSIPDASLRSPRCYG